MVFALGSTSFAVMYAARLYSMKFSEDLSQISDVTETGCNDVKQSEVRLNGNGKEKSRETNGDGDLVQCGKFFEPAGNCTLCQRTRAGDVVWSLEGEDRFTAAGGRGGCSKSWKDTRNLRPMMLLKFEIMIRE